MRLRTLPVSLAGIVASAAMGLIYAHHLRVLPLILCVLFAVTAQIASNFANEYFDYRDGLDKPGRVGPRRGVTEGDITPRAMRNATILTIFISAAFGCCLIFWGGWWLIACGVAIILGLLAYSAGPYPLSRHGLGEIAVIIFFGIVPVCLTFWLTTGILPQWPVYMASVGIGLLGANVLVVNNYRDIEDDRAVGKKTIAVRIGPHATRLLYGINSFMGVALTIPVWMHAALPASPTPTSITLGICLPIAIFCALFLPLNIKLKKTTGTALNPLLGATARAMTAYAALTFIAIAL